MNPYIQLLEQFPTRLEEDEHRRKRNATQKETLANDPKVNVDRFLTGEVVDDRNLCCILARPDAKVKNTIAKLQKKLTESVSDAESIWLTQPENLHMTVLEVCTLRPVEETVKIARTLRQCDQLLDIANEGPELDRPLLCFDATAIALSFTSKQESQLVYRAKLFEYVSQHVDIKPRYFSVSSHITIARFVKPLAPEDVKSLVAAVETINNTITNFSWKVSSCEVNAGVSWYGAKGLL